MRRRTRSWWFAAALASLPVGEVTGQSGFGGLDYSGFSAFGSTAGYGAGGTAGIALGPRQQSRRESSVPAVLPSPPSDALPAAAPPPDPVLDAPLLGAPLLPEHPLGVERPAPAGVGVPLPPTPSPEAGYGSAALGYGPPVHLATPPAPVADDPGIAPRPGPGVASAPFAGAEADLPAPPPRLPDGPDRRGYLAGMLGADFATLEVGQGPNPSAPLFTAGGAVGMAYERENGWFRGEFEARYRDPIGERFTDPGIGGAGVAAVDGWSAMVNGWRDFEISDRFGAYLGGGIGGGGYRAVFDGDFAPLGATLSGNTRLAGFAWQAGTGVTWLVNDRLALDLGYRFFALDGGNAVIVVDAPPISFSDAVGTRYSASELLFTVRVFEPFRGWRD